MMVARCSWCKDNCIPDRYVKVINGWLALDCPQCGEITEYQPAPKPEQPDAQIGKIVWVKLK